MNLLDIKLPPGSKITVIGDVHGHSEQYFKILDKIKPDSKNILISVGDILDKGFGPKAESQILKSLKELCEQKICYVVKGNHEVKHLRKANSNNDWSDELKWIDTWPLAVSFQFVNRNRVTIVHGGVVPSHTWEDLKTNTDLVYIRTVDEKGEYIPLAWLKDKDNIKKLSPVREGKAWGTMYDGRFGYIAAGHDAQKDGIAKFWNHCCNIDTACYATGILTAQPFSEAGKEELVQVTGEAAKPVLNYL